MTPETESGLRSALRRLAPTPATVIVAIALVAVSALLRYLIQAGRITDIWSFGFPFVFYETWGPCPKEAICREFSLAPVLVNTGLWYALVAGLAAAIRKA